MEKSFEQIKREPLLPEWYYRENLEYKEKSTIEFEKLLAAPTEKFRGQKINLRWTLAYKSLETLILRYSGGEDVASLKHHAILSLKKFQRYDEQEPDDKFKLWEFDSYQYMMWLISLATLLGLKEWIPQIATWVSINPDDGQDKLAGRLFDCLGVKFPTGDALLHEKPYAHLLLATETQGEEQQKTMTTYLKRWYAGMKDCYWHDLHKQIKAGFFGYWAFEAGLVTFLWNIDDTPYREMRFYPKDLVDYARQPGRLG
jgi:hypothetical protein